MAHEYTLLQPGLAPPQFSDSATRHIGSHTGKHLQRRGCDVVNIVNLSTGHLDPDPCRVVAQPPREWIRAGLDLDDNPAAFWKQQIKAATQPANE